VNTFRETELGLIPKDWAVRRIQDICERPQYGFTESANVEKVGPKFLRITDIVGMTVNWDEVPYCVCPAKKLPNYQLKHDDIVFARIGATTGKSYIIKHPPLSVFASYLIRLRTKPDACPDFLLCYFNSPLYWSQVNANKGSSLKGGVNGSILSQLRVICPSLSEQRKIAAVLVKIQRAVEVQDAILANVRELKKSMMNRLFTHGLWDEKLKQTEIGKMPVSWEIVKLGDLAKENGGAIQTGPFGSQLHAYDYIKDGIPVVNPTHMAENRINHDELPSVSVETATRLSRHAVKTGDILFARRGEIGRHGFVTNSENGWLCGTGCFLVRINSKRADNQYLSYLFDTEYYTKWLVAHAAGVIMPNLNNSVLEKIPVKVPRIEEQQEIVRCFRFVNEKIAVHESKKAALQDLFKTTLNQLMTGAVRVADLDIDTSEVEAA
jgi:type I restriction enzyme, S subunit